MVTGEDFKKETIKYLENKLAEESFAEVKASGFLDRFVFCDTASEDDNVNDIIQQYEEEAGKKLGLWG